MNMVTRSNSDNTEVRIKRVPIWKVFWFTRLNNLIHEEDPIFKKAQKTFISRAKFFISFTWKILTQHRFELQENGKTAGALSLDKRKNSFFVYAVGVKKEFRRKGYGTRLMHFTEDYARKHKKSYITFSVLLANTAAMQLYKKLGYKSMGLGLTLIRYFKRHLPSVESLDLTLQFQFRQFSSVKKGQKNAYFWWKKEVEALCGEEIADLSTSDGILAFDFKRDWHLYEVLVNGEPKGFISLFPSAVISTLVLFSAPTTWTNKWLAHLLYFLTSEKLHTKLAVGTNKKKELSLIGDKIIQIFMTYQHLDSIVNSLTMKKPFSHDVTEDRQILFKKIT